MTDEQAPRRIVAIGGSVRERSSTELVLRAVLDAAEAQGARTQLFSGPELLLPPYEYGKVNDAGRRFIDAVASADALVIGSPGYHGTVSGVVKNVLDYLEELREAPRVYLDGMPVGCVVTAYGWQAAVNTLQSLRMVVHALRGWPTPLGVALNMTDAVLDEHGHVADEKAAGAVRAMADQLMRFSLARSVSAATGD